MRPALAWVVVVLLPGCASPEGAEEPEPEAAAPQPPSPTAWWNLTFDLSTLTSAQAAGTYVHPTQTFHNCVALDVARKPILAGVFEAAWDDPVAEELVLYTWQRDNLDPNATGRASARGPSALALEAPPSEDRAREVLFVGVEAPADQAVAAGTAQDVQLTVRLLLQAPLAPDPNAYTLHGCSFDQHR